MAEYTASNKPAKRRRRIRTQKAPTEPEVSAIASRNARALQRSKSREETDAAAEQETQTPTDGGEATETEAEAGSDTDSTNGGSRDMAGTADDEWAIWYSVKEGKEEIEENKEEEEVSEDLMASEADDERDAAEEKGDGAADEQRDVVDGDGIYQARPAGGRREKTKKIEDRQKIEKGNEADGYKKGPDAIISTKRGAVAIDVTGMTAETWTAAFNFGVNGSLGMANTNLQSNEARSTRPNSQLTPLEQRHKQKMNSDDAKHVAKQTGARYVAGCYTTNGG